MLLANNNLLLYLLAAVFFTFDGAAQNITNYAPQTNVPCPDISSSPLIRVFTPETQALHPAEAVYIALRTAGPVNDAWHAWLGDGSAIGYNVSLFDGNWSKIGIGLSGGGYRAAQYGAGVLQAFDARNSTAVAKGTGGLLQVASYISGLSGGSWLTGSLYFNDFPTIQELVLGNGGNLSGWLLDLGLATPGGINLFDDKNQWFFGGLVWSVMAKAAKGLDTSLTDPWARTISYHFLNTTTRDNFFTNDSSHGAGQLWSRIPEIPTVARHEAPFPLVVANSRPVGSNLTTTLPPEPIVYEITPLEFGSWDPNLSAMANLSYIGSPLNNGRPPNSSACVKGFDQAGFMMGTSASLFNQILDVGTNTLKGFNSDDAGGLLYLLRRLLQEVRTRANDVANWPNPFQGTKPTTFEDSSSYWLELIDGSSNLENIPLGSLFVKARALDVVIAVDASADDPMDRFPNGTSPIYSAKRMATILKATHASFPPIPSSSDEFISTGVNQRPTFFGCDPSHNPPEFPLVIYLPNSSPIDGSDPVTNTNTFKLSYTAKHTQLILSQAFGSTTNGFTKNSTSPDGDFGKCLQCAAIDPCFSKYCFDPRNLPTNKDIVGRKYTYVDPDPPIRKAVAGLLGKVKTALITGLVIAAVLLGLAAFFLFRCCRARRSRRYKAITTQSQDEPQSTYTDRAGSLELHNRETQPS